MRLAHTFMYIPWFQCHYCTHDDSHLNLILLGILPRRWEATIVKQLSYSTWNYLTWIHTLLYISWLPQINSFYSNFWMWLHTRLQNGCCPPDFSSFSFLPNFKLCKYELIDRITIFWIIPTQTFVRKTKILLCLSWAKLSDHGMLNIFWKTSCVGEAA